MRIIKAKGKRQKGKMKNEAGSFCLRVFAARRRRGQSGYALLMVVFLGAVMIIGTMAAVPSVITQGRREKEEEMIWRGEQYARAVKLYYRKNGRFPQSIEDLEKKKTGIRYLRQAYKDPMNREDGSWRLIYVAPNGVLIGSLTRTAAIQLGPSPGQPGSLGAPAGPRPQQGQPGQPASPQGSGSTGPQPTPITGTLGSGPVIGGNIIGIGSKVGQFSLKVYNGRTTYREWEFIWDPAKDAAIQGAPVGVPGGQPSTPQRPGGPPGGPMRPRP